MSDIADILLENDTLRIKLRKLNKKIRELEVENNNLKKALMLRVERNKIDWRKIATNSKYDDIIFDCIRNFLTTHLKPATTDAIVSCVRRKVYSTKGYKPNSETISRRLRKLRELGMLASPKQGEYTIPAGNEGDTNANQPRD